MGNAATSQCGCFANDLAEEEKRKLNKKSFSIVLPGSNNSSLYESDLLYQIDERYIEARDAGPACSSERRSTSGGTLRRKPTSIVVKAIPGTDAIASTIANELASSGSFSPISETGASVISGRKFFDESAMRISDDQYFEEDHSCSLTDDDITDYAICRASIKKTSGDTLDDLDECRDDV